MIISISKIEKIILSAFALMLPWSIMLATPQLQIGYWGQVEGMIAFNHFCSAIVAFLLLKLGFSNKELREYFSHPLVLLPSLIAIYSTIASFFHRLPVLTFYGSPQIGEGVFWYFSLSILTLLYFIVIQNNRLKIILFINIFLIVLVVSVGSFYPLITGVVISFFGFNDWLAMYFTALCIAVIYFLTVLKIKGNKDFISLLFFLLLGPLFWKIDNNSAIALWLILVFVWVFWLLSSYKIFKDNYIIKVFYNPLFFTMVPIILSLIMLISSFVFWDGLTDQTDEITSNNLGHLATLIARGSIVRVILEHLTNINALLFGHGWGSISELLIASFTPEVFYQINTGNRVHFHTHNEFFEHLFSIGIVGTFLYVMYIYSIFKFSFKKSMSISLVWLLYFCLCSFWFQWVSIIPFIAMLAAFLMLNTKGPFNYAFSGQFAKFFTSRTGYSSYLFLVATFLLYGAYIGYFTAYNEMESTRAGQLIDMARESEKNGKCSNKIYDFGKGGFQFSQKFLGFSDYYKNQVINYGKLNESDQIVLNWYLCASNEMVKSENYTLELLNVHINVLSMISILPGKMGEAARLGVKKHIDDWEHKLNILLSLAPKRVDQATPLIAFYIKNINDMGVKRVCNKIEKSKHYQGYCDLALGSVLLKEGNFEKGMKLIGRANDNGVLDSSVLDIDTANSLKKLLLTYKKSK
ncbi:hypothetical protein OAE09_04710 [Alphaproteobacteria bacterium]|nr:hypothetical protein [Alphaproteobacteria bacterium]